MTQIIINFPRKPTNAAITEILPLAAKAGGDIKSLFVTLRPSPRGDRDSPYRR